MQRFIKHVSSRLTQNTNKTVCVFDNSHYGLEKVCFQQQTGSNVCFEYLFCERQPSGYHHCIFRSHSCILPTHHLNAVKSKTLQRVASVNANQIENHCVSSFCEYRYSKLKSCECRLMYQSFYLAFYPKQQKHISYSVQAT